MQQRQLRRDNRLAHKAASFDNMYFTLKSTFFQNICSKLSLSHRYHIFSKFHKTIVGSPGTRWDRSQCRSMATGHKARWRRCTCMVHIRLIILKGLMVHQLEGHRCFMVLHHMALDDRFSNYTISLPKYTISLPRRKFTRKTYCHLVH